jgi:hypothetical protein
MKTYSLLILLVLPAFVFGQFISVEKSISDADYPDITWQTTGSIDTSAFRIYRASVKNKIFNEIHTIHYAEIIKGNDTIRFTVIDTTLTAKGIYLYYIVVSRNQEDVKSEVSMGHNYGLIPTPQMTYFRAAPLDDRKAVRLEWQLNYKQTLNSMSLYRSTNYDSGYVKITDLSPEMVTYIDPVPVANEPLFYFMVLHDYFGGKTTSVRIPAFATFAEKPVRPQNINGEFKHDTVFINWQNAGMNIIGYRVYRSVENGDFQLLNDMSANLSETGSFADASPVVSSAVKLKYYVRTVSDGFVESNSSDTLEFYVMAHKPVLPPSELDYVTDANGNIKLLWMPPKEGLNISYNIYLTGPDGKEIKMNKEKWTQNFFVDTVYRIAGKYIYAVEGVGYNDTVSEKRISVAVYRYPPKLHVILNLNKRKDGIEISWKRPLNEHVSRLMLYKKHGNGDAVLKKSFSPSEDVVYLDTKVSRGDNYLYSLIAVMDNGKKISVNDGVELKW